MERGYNKEVFQQEEEIVRQLFQKEFQVECTLYPEILEYLQEILLTIKATTNQYDKYAVSVLAALNLKGFVSAFDRLEKGYISDSEALLKKNIESFLAQAYFEHNIKDAQQWCEGKKPIGKIKGNRRQLSQYLDEINNNIHFFPTDAEDFFEEYIYRVGYENSNILAHLDFGPIHTEIGVDSLNPLKYASTLQIGPKFDAPIMKITLNRLVMYLMFQATYLKRFAEHKDETKHNQLGNRVKELFA